MSTLRQQIESLRATAETGEQWAEICRLAIIAEQAEPQYCGYCHETMKSPDDCPYDGRCCRLVPLEDYEPAETGDAWTGGFADNH